MQTTQQPNPRQKKQDNRSLPPAMVALVEKAVREAENKLLGAESEDGISEADIVPQDLGSRLSHECAVAGSMMLAATYVGPENSSVWEGVEDVVVAIRSAIGDIDPEALIVSQIARATLAASLHLFHTGVLPTIPAVCGFLAKSRMLERLGGARRVAALTEHVPSAWNVGHHIKQLIEEKRADDMGSIAEKIRSALKLGKPINEIIVAESEAMKQLATVECAGTTPSVEGVSSVLNRITTKDDDSTAAVRWHWNGIQRLTGSMKRGSVVVLTGPPGIGKTAFVQQQEEFAASVLGLKCLCIRLESDLDQVVTRHGCQRHYLDAKHVNTKEFTNADWDAMSATKRTWPEFAGKLFYHFPSGANCHDLDAIVSDHIRTNGPIDLLTIDTFNALKSPFSNKAPTDYDSMSHTMLSINETTRRANCATMLLAQQVKEAFTGPPRRPTLSSVKGGTPTEKGKQVIALYYHEDLARSLQAVPGEIVVLKTNDGSPGYVRSVYIRRALLHVEETPHNVTDKYAGILRKYHFSASTRRPEKGDAPGHRMQADADPDSHEPPDF
jgi:replicative DNA helicase